MSATDAIDRINSVLKIRIASSPIHGVGVFATRDVLKGEKLYADQAPFPYKLSAGNLDKLLPEVKQLLLERWPTVLVGKAFACPDAIMQSYTNHSDDPNYDAHNDLALRDIKQGEEITENYRHIDGWRTAYPWLSTG